MIQVVLAHIVTQTNNSLKSDGICDCNLYIVCSECNVHYIGIAITFSHFQTVNCFCDSMASIV